jgi:murein DD-endopeptidase MepM/ murein hydrolase activator NlpD
VNAASAARCATLRWGAWAAAFAFCIAFLFAAPVSADGLILDARPAGDAGPQLDAAAISPIPARTADSAASAARAAANSETYRIRPGDTLAAIAGRFGMGAGELASLNGIANPDRIIAGQVLRVGSASAATPALPSGGPLERVQFWPWPPAQGQTLAVWLAAREPMTFSVTLDGRAYPVVTRDRRGWALIPIPPLSEPGIRPLEIAAGDTRVRLPITIAAGAFPSVNIPAEVSQPILSQAETVRAETARMDQLFSGATPGGWTPRDRFLSPLEGDFPRTSPYGSRRTYGTSPAITAHAGEDFSAAAGTPVFAPTAGTVVLAEPLFVRGNAVVLDHGSGVYTGYWHLSELNVQPGEQVSAGQRMGAVGSTGLSTGAHLHWEMRVGGLPVDPLQWLEN